MAEILIVDDDARIVELTSWFLEQSGHRVRSALSYAAARRELRARVPDLLLADLELGVENGREELPRLSAEGLLPPTLVLSGFLDAELQRELGRVPGVVGALSKPIDPEVLEQYIARHARPPVRRVPGEVIPQAPPPGAGGGLAPERPVAEAATEDEDEDDGWVEILPLEGEQRS